MSPEEATPPAVARALVGSALEVRRGEHVVVVSWNHSLPWAAACVTEARRAGARAFLILEDESAFWRSVEGAIPSRRWAGLSRPARAALAQADALVYFPGPADRPRLHALPSHLLAPFQGADEEWLSPIRRTHRRAVRCLLGYASDQQAEHWKVPGAMWRSQLIRGITEVDYGILRKDGKRAAALLAKGRELRLTAGNGTDLRLRLRGRTPWVDDGTVDADDRRRGRVVTAAPAGAVVVAVE